MFFHPLDGILGSTAKVRILRVLLPLTDPVSGREVQRLARGRSRSNVAAALDDLSAMGVLRRMETRGSHLFQVNREHELVAPLAALFAREEGRGRAFAAALGRGLERRGVAERIHAVILYGSSARGDAGPGSDVDLLVVVDSDLIVSAVGDALYETGEELARTQGLRLSPLVLPADRVRERAEAGDPLMEAIRTEGRLLMGEELDRLVAAW